MRALLDVHPDVRCGEETRVIPDLLGVLRNWENPGHQKLLDQAGVSRNVLNDAVSAFISEVVQKHGPEAKVLCNKDPLTMNHSKRLREMFPNAKFILMIRDGRAVVHSMIEREVPVVGFSRSDPEQMLQQWNITISRMYQQCSELDPKICLKVYYERLILHPREELQRIFSFIGLPFVEDVLQHEKFVGKEIKLSPHEFSTDQVKKKINKEALRSWVGFYEDRTLKRIDAIAPMLKILGYDTEAIMPEYNNLPEL